MKRTVLLSFLSLLSLLWMSCAKDAQIIDPENGFDIPATDEFILYIEHSNKGRMKIATEAFAEAYPEVDMKVEVLGQDEYFARLRVEIPAGDGPDAIWCVDTYLPDVYKTLASGVFEDLTPYFDNDENFRRGDYVPATWNSGVLNEKQYVVPIQFELDTLITTEELLEENGIPCEGLDTYDGFLDACLTFRKNNPGKELFSVGADKYYINELFAYTGVRFLDPDGVTLNLDPESVKHLADVSKAWYPQTGDAVSELYENRILARNLFCIANSLTPQWVASSAYTLYHYHETPVLISVQNSSGYDLAPGFDFMAIPVGSANKLNGYRFIRLVLSYDYQKKTTSLSSTPVLKEAIEHNLTVELKKHEKGDVYSDFGQYLYDEITNALNSIDEINFIRQYVRSSSNNIIKAYVEEKIDFDKMYRKLENFLSLYRDE